jgi:iron complex transport system ATP-binding protein
MAMLELFAQRVASGESSVVAVLHDPNLARHYFQRALLLFDDGSWLEGESQDVLTQGNLSRLYAYPLHTLNTEGRPWFVPQASRHVSHSTSTSTPGQSGDQTHE